MYMKEFNKAMLDLFERTGGLELVHEIASSKSTMILYQHFLSERAIKLSDVIEQGVLAESTTYRAAKRLRELGLIELLEKEPRGKGLSGPRRRIWRLKT